MDRLARNVGDLLQIVKMLTKRSVRVEFKKEGLTFTEEDSPTSNLMLTMLGGVAEFERALIRERQREGISLAKQRGAYRGRKKSLNDSQVLELRQRIAAGVPRAAVARALGISRGTLYQYWRPAPPQE
jgi:DNA invertase Pin-like site-specific DNA recombinase